MIRGSAVAGGLHRLPPRIHRLMPVEQRTDLRHRLGRFYAWEAGAGLPPASRQPGETTGPPDFVGIGVANAGVRWWYDLVARHPGVYIRPDIRMARHYLSHFATRAFGDREVEHYCELFPRRPGTITGEWTPSYAALPWVAELLARAAPKARLLLMVRNPIDRLRTGLAQSIENRRPQVGVHIADAVDRGFYGAQLRRVLEFFPRERVLVLQSERCAAEPAAQLATTCAFLGLDGSHLSAQRSLRAPDTGLVVPALDSGAIDQLVRIYADDVDELDSMVSGLDLSLWPQFSERRGSRQRN